MQQRTVSILYENPEWLPPITEALSEVGVDYTTWDLRGGSVTLDNGPSDQLFLNKVSASAHSRGNVHVPAVARSLISHLESNGNKVLNGGAALDLEMSKVRQYDALRKYGLPFPGTVACFGIDTIVDAALTIGFPLILKPNRGGKGLGVQKFDSLEALQALVDQPIQLESVDGIWLVQEYIATSQPEIVRMEFIGGSLFYAVRVNTSGGFELCPAEACQLDANICALGDNAGDMFSIIDDFSAPFVDACERMLLDYQCFTAGIEFIEDTNGQPYLYDINVNTNYNPEAEQKAQLFGARRLAELIKQSC